MKSKSIIFVYAALIISVILFSLGPNVVKLLVTMGGSFGLKYPDSISFCNVLFVGNLCAALVSVVVFGPIKLSREIFSLRWQTKLFVFISFFISAAYPALVFIGLEYTSVVNLVIISRLNSIVYLILGFIVYRNKVHWQETVGYTVIAISVFVMLFINNHGFSFSKGDLILLLSTVFFALGEIVSAKILPNCSEKSYVFIRNLGSAVIFFIIVIVLFDSHHFAEAFRGELWILMLIYAALAIVLAQLLWLFSLKRLPLSFVSNSRLFDPIFILAFAYLLLGEIPSVSQFIIIGIIIISVVLPKIILYRHNKQIMVESNGVGGGLVGK